MYDEMSDDELRAEVERMETILAQTRHHELKADCRMVIDICQKILAERSQREERA